jgi:hypothetical protein
VFYRVPLPALLLIFFVTFTKLITRRFAFSWQAGTSSANMARRQCEHASSARLLVGIFSTQSDKEAQERQRESFKNACSLRYYLANRDVELGVSAASGKFKLRCPIVYTFVLGAYARGDAENATLSRSRLAHEDDVIYLDIFENMNEGKTNAWFKYANELVRRYEIDYVAKMDLDTFMNVNLLSDFVRANLPLAPETGRDNRRRYGGVLREFNTCGRFKHCALLSGRVYMSGQFYFVSSDLIEFLSSEDDNTDKMRVGHEDLEFGLKISLYPRTINLVVMSNEQVWFHNQNTKTATGWYDTQSILMRDPHVLPVVSDENHDLSVCLANGWQSCLTRNIGAAPRFSS